MRAAGVAVQRFEFRHGVFGGKYWFIVATYREMVSTSRVLTDGATIRRQLLW